MEEGEETLDEALVAAVRDGSERAFNELVDRHQQAVRTFLRGITAYDDAEDMAQETFLAVWAQPAATAAATSAPGCSRSPGARPRARSAAGFAGDAAIRSITGPRRRRAR